MDKTPVQNPDVSVIIPNWNGEQFIGACLRCVYGSDVTHSEVIVVDNGSSDRSIEIIEQDFPQVRLIRLKKNSGFAAACNRGIQESSGKFVFLLNNDVELEPKCLSELCKALEQHPECSMAGGKILRFDHRDVIDAAGDVLTVGGAPSNRGHGTKDAGQFDREEYVFGACAGAALYRRELFEKIGLFDEDFFAYMEDVDFNLRALLSGYGALYTPRARCYHHGNATLGTLSQRHVYLTNRNKLFVLLKNFKTNWLALHFFDIWRHQMSMAVLFSTTNRGWSFFKSRIAALIKIPRMIVKRHIFLCKVNPEWESAYQFLDKPGV